MVELDIEDVCFSYPSRDILKDIEFKAEQGEILGIIGQNGCGKTTLLKCINSTLSPKKGIVTVDGKAVESMTKKEIARSMGFVMQTTSTTFPFTVYETVMMGRYSRKDALDSEKEEDTRIVYQALKDTGTLKFADRDIDELSGGERRRVMIARALVHSPRLLLLDEPTAGLDPQTRKRIWDTVNGLNRDGGLTVLLTTHYMEEAAGADDIVIVNHGEIAAHGTPAMLREKYCSDRMTVVPKDMAAVTRTLADAGVGFSVHADTVEIPLASTVDAVPLVAMLDGMLESLEVRNGTLDDAFIRITGEEME